jgi:hypothetical protein
VEKALIERVQGVQGRIIATQFASNLHRIHSMKKAADSCGRRICFMGASLTTYLEAAWRSGNAPFDPSELVDPSEIEGMDPSSLLIITTGSQAEPQVWIPPACSSSPPGRRPSPRYGSLQPAHHHHRVAGQAPGMDPSSLLIITTESQAEPQVWIPPACSSSPPGRRPRPRYDEKRNSINKYYFNVIL